MKKPSETPDFFRWAYNGLELSKSFWQALKARGVEIESFSYSDTREEWDLFLEYRGGKFRGYAGTTFELSRVVVGSPDSETADHYNMSYYDPPTLETALYQVFCALDGEKIDRDRVVGETIIRWMD